MQLDLSYSKSLPIVLASHRHVEFVLVGCGGNGGWLAPSIARLLQCIQSQSTKTASALFIDPDTIEQANVPRQNFMLAEIGMNKAQVLATRYALAYGLKIGAIASPFNVGMIERGWNKLTVVVGCVDNAAARREIRKSLALNDNNSTPSVWWLDAGNHVLRGAGQVLLGSTNDFNPKSAFNNPNFPNFCINLPSPSLQHLQLLSPKEELSVNSLSCAELAIRFSQSLFVNQRVAAEASEYLLQLTLTGGLRRFATYFDTGAGSARSYYTAPESLNKFAQI